MIQIFDALLLNQYIYTPLTWIHYISTRYKVYVTIFLLITMPYQKYSYIMATIIIYITAFISMFLPKIYYLYIPQLFIYTFIYLVFNQLPAIKNQLIKKDLLKINCHLIKQNYYIILPKFTMRIIGITVVNLISLKLLLYTTMYENMALFLFPLINKKDWILKEVLLIAALSNQFLEQMPRYIRIYWISIKIKNNTSLIIKPFINNHFIYSFILYITNQIYRISSIFHIRKVNLNNFRIYDFDYMNTNIIYNTNL